MKGFIRLCQEFVAVRRHKHGRFPRGAPPGWEELGAGHFGEAWAHRRFPALALKISGPGYWGCRPARYVHRNIHEGGVAYDAWPVYAEYCRDNPGEHLPDILHFETVSRGISWAILPRYESPEYGDNAARDEARYALRRGISGLRGVRRMRDSMGLQVDVHHGNVMLDPANGAWVLTDPFSFSGEHADCTAPYDSYYSEH